MVITDEIRAGQLEQEYDNIVERIKFYRHQIQVVCDYNSNTQNSIKDPDMNLKRLAGKIAYLNRELTKVRYKIKLVKY